MQERMGMQKNNGERAAVGRACRSVPTRGGATPKTGDTSRGLLTWINGFTTLIPPREQPRIQRGGVADRDGEGTTIQKRESGEKRRQEVPDLKEPRKVSESAYIGQSFRAAGTESSGSFVELKIMREH